MANGHRLVDVIDTVRADWEAAGRLVLPEDSPPAEFAEPERTLDTVKLERERERKLEEQRARQETEP